MPQYAYFPDAHWRRRLSQHVGDRATRAGAVVGALLCFSIFPEYHTRAVAESARLSLGSRRVLLVFSDSLTFPPPARLISPMRRGRSETEYGDRLDLSRPHQDPKRLAGDPNGLILRTWRPRTPRARRLSYIPDSSPLKIPHSPRMPPENEPGDRRDFSMSPGDTRRLAVGPTPGFNAVLPM